MKGFIVLVAVAAGAVAGFAHRPRASRVCTICSRRIPHAVKIGYTVFTAILVPVYTRHYGLANFLWFSNLALFGGLAAIWLESRWLASMQVVSVSALELFWIGDYTTGLLTGESPTGLTAYMFDAANPRSIRALSLYHLVLPFLLLWVAYRLGYERRAWMAQSLLAVAILLVCYYFTGPSDNINWVFGPGEEPQTQIPAGFYLVLLMLAFTGGVYLPTHVAVSKFYRSLDPRNQPGIPARDRAVQNDSRYLPGRTSAPDNPDALRR